jgi:iron(III) transport system substrate-binding protein
MRIDASRTTGLLALSITLLSTACERAPQAETSPDASPATQPAGTVVVYTALDRQFSAPILATFEAETGIDVEAVYDTESTKTVGLVNRIISERNRPRCDVFWNNEILNTLRLKREGLLQPCNPANAAHYPPAFRDDEGYWFGFAARARVLIVNTDLVPPDQMPTSILDLGDPQWKGKVGIAKPLFGTTASHAAVLFAELGRPKAEELFQTWEDNDIQIVAGNKTCAEMIAAGRLAFGLTDTDDAIIEVEQNKPVRIVFPDAGPDQIGTLLLPNTLALIDACPNPAAGAQLIDFLLSEPIEARLAAGPSAQIPLHDAASTPSRVANLTDLHPMDADFDQAAAAFEPASRYIESRFLKP